MGKSAEEIRVILNIPRLTPEEEAKARQDHRWIFDDWECFGILFGEGVDWSLH